MNAFPSCTSGNSKELGQSFDLQKCESATTNTQSNEGQNVETVDEHVEEIPPDMLNLNSNEVHADSQPWLQSIFILPENLILQRGGKDALYYLRFQRHIIVFLFVVTMLSMGIILPINLQGTYILIWFSLIFGYFRSVIIALISSLQDSIF